MGASNSNNIGYKTAGIILPICLDYPVYTSILVFYAGPMPLLTLNNKT